MRTMRTKREVDALNGKHIIEYELIENEVDNTVKVRNLTSGKEILLTEYTLEEAEYMLEGREVR